MRGWSALPTVSLIRCSLPLFAFTLLAVLACPQNIHAQDVLVTSGNAPQSDDVLVLPPRNDALSPPKTVQNPTLLLAREPAALVINTPLKEKRQPALPEPPPMRFVAGLEEPLVATGSTAKQDDADLDAALAAYRNQKPDANTDFVDHAKPLTEFLGRHPSSPWRMAVLTNLGLGYYHAGYFSKAFDAWEQAWKAGRHAITPQAKALVDRAVGELARMHARVGHAQELEQMFAELSDRKVSGSATEMLTGAREGLSKFHITPGIAYLCGPKALRNLLLALKAKPEQIKTADAARSGSRGFNLQELSALAGRAMLPHKLAHRVPGQVVPVPSVVNWNVHHYAAIVEKKGESYHIQDPTFGGNDLWVSQKQIDTESSGYFLVPDAVQQANAAGDKKNVWRIVDAGSDEAMAVYGMGYITDSDPGATRPNDPKIYPASANCGMCGYNAHLTSVSVNLNDTPVGYAPSKGPDAFFTLTYNQREAGQPANFAFGNVSQKWTHNWMAWVEDDPNNQYVLPYTHVRGGGYVTYYSPYGFNYVNYLDPEFQTGAVLYRLPSNTAVNSYERRFPDGSKEVYGLSNGALAYPRRFFLTQVVDPQGNAVTINYDAQFRITSLTDAEGRNTTFTYGLAGYPLLVTKVTDPFGRYAQINYDASARLTSITDVLGITSSFGYDAGSLVNTLNTPYGISHFAYGLDAIGPGNNVRRWLEATDPLGFTDRVEFSGYFAGLPDSDAIVPAADNILIANTFLNHAISAYWNKHVYPITHTDYTKAQISNWLGEGSVGAALPALKTFKNPLESRVWFYYPYEWWNGYSLIATVSSRPTAIARVLDDGTTQAQFATYDIYPDSGGIPLYHGYTNITNATDALGRTTYFDIDPSNNIDVLKVRQKTDAAGTLTTIGSYGGYNAQHRPATYTDAAGKVWQYTYNAAGQLLTAKNPLLQTTTYTYDTKGRLSTIKNAANVVVLTMNYLANCETVNPNKQNCDLPVSVKDTSATSTSEPNGRTVSYQYDALDRVTRVTYPDGTFDAYDYKFQSGPLVGTQSLDLRKVTDRLGRVTTYDYDANRRLISVTEPLTGGATPTSRTTQYQYYENGTLKNLIDAKGNITHWEIDIQSRPISKTYAYGTPSAKTETYTYENTTSRLKSITDALGQVTSFTYNLDDSIAAVTYTNTVNATPNVGFTYDPFFPRRTAMTDGNGTTLFTYKPIGTLGALQPDTENGPYLSGDSVAYGYDAAGRVNARTVAGGNESFGYDTIGRLNSHGTSLGTFTYTYLGQTGQPAQRSVTNGTITTRTTWGYDTNLNDLRLKTITNTGVTRNFALTANPYQITGITDTAAATHPWLSQTHGYGYDLADRLLTATQTAPGNNTFGYDKLDNATTVTNPGSTTVNPTYNGFNQLATWGAKTYTYDNNGNTLSGDGLKTYKWDAANRLIEINYVGGTDKTTFSYDGLGRRTVVADTVAGVTTTTRFLWCGERLCQSRGATDTVRARYFPEGEYIASGTKKYVYQTDQLGSVRDVIDAATGTRVAALDYGPYGNRTRTNGTVTPGYEYAGLFYHPKSGLMLSATRAYDTGTGRWLNRDPIREAGGINLYGYVGASPVNWIDPIGLKTYRVNRMLVVLGEGAQPQWVPITHTFVFTTNPDGSIARTYSWGNDANLHGWNIDQPEDIDAAWGALGKDFAEQVGDDSLDPYIDIVYHGLNRSENKHPNGWIANNCKSEADTLISAARQLRLLDSSAVKKAPFSF